MMPVKLIMTWDIAAEHEQDYFEFILGEFIPGLQRIGLQPVDAWVTMYGNYPQIQIGVLAESLAEARHVLDSDSWKRLLDKLLGMVQHFSYKIVAARPGFQF